MRLALALVLALTSFSSSNATQNTSIKAISGNKTNKLAISKLFAKAKQRVTHGQRRFTVKLADNKNGNGEKEAPKVVVKISDNAATKTTKQEKPTVMPEKTPAENGTQKNTYLS